MVQLKHLCESCESSFSIHFDEEYCEDSPHYCPFCGEYLIDDIEIENED